MRLVQATLSEDVVEDVKQSLQAEGIDYFMTHETGRDKYSHVLYISLPEDEVEHVLEQLYTIGLDEDDHVVLVNTEVDISGRTNHTGEPTSSGGHARIASAELHAKTEDLIPDRRTFITMMVLSTIVATTGVLLDSSAVVVGSMVLAPLFGPAVSAAVGTVIDDQELFWHGITFQVLGIGIAVASGSIAAWTMKTAYLLPSGFALAAAPQVVARLSPDLLSLVVAMVAGIAGVISIATDAGRALVGVMMAAALLPPAAIVGVAVAWEAPFIAVHSAILLAVNLLAINFAGLVTLWYLGYRPQSWIQVPQTRISILKRGGVLFIAILITSAFLWNVTYANAQRAQIENTVEQEVTDLLNDEQYANVTYIDSQVIQDQTNLNQKPEKVIVTVGSPPGEPHPQLHREINLIVEDSLGREIPVDVRIHLLLKDRETVP